MSGNSTPTCGSIAIKVGDHDVRLAVLENGHLGIREDINRLEEKIVGLCEKQEEGQQQIYGKLDTIAAHTMDIHTRTLILETKEAEKAKKRRWVFGVVGTVLGGSLVALLKYLLPFLS